MDVHTKLKLIYYSSLYAATDINNYYQNTVHTLAMEIESLDTVVKFRPIMTTMVILIANRI